MGSDKGKSLHTLETRLEHELGKVHRTQTLIGAQYLVTEWSTSGLAFAKAAPTSHFLENHHRIFANDRVFESSEATLSGTGPVQSSVGLGATKPDGAKFGKPLFIVCVAPFGPSKGSLVWNALSRPDPWRPDSNPPLRARVITPDRPWSRPVAVAGLL